MHVYTRRNALVGWIVLRLVRRRLRQRLHATGAALSSRRLVVGTGLAGSAALAALVVRRAGDEDDA